MLRTKACVAPLAFSYMAPPGCPLYQGHLDELVLSSLVLFASISSLSPRHIFTGEHATWEHSGAVVVFLFFSASAGDAGCQEGLSSADAPARHFLSVLAVPPQPLTGPLPYGVSSFFTGLHIWQSRRDPHQAASIPGVQIHAETGICIEDCAPGCADSWSHGRRWWGCSQVTLRSSYIVLPCVSWGR